MSELSALIQRMLEEEIARLKTLPDDEEGEETEESKARREIELSEYSDINYFFRSVRKKVAAGYPLGDAIAAVIKNPTGDAVP